MVLMRRLARHVWLVVIAPLTVGVVVGVLVARLTDAGSTSSHGRTDVRLFDPNSELATTSPPKVGGHSGGTCGPVSVVDPAALVVSCNSASGDSYLACFGAYTPEVLCVDSPWSRRAFALSVTRYYFDIGKPPHVIGVKWNPRNLKKLPPRGTEFWARTARQPMQTKSPWAMELTNGQKCVRQWRRPGMFVPGVRGIPATYDCDTVGGVNSTDSGDVRGLGGFVIGEVDRTAEPWTVDYLRVGANATTQVSVTRAWY